ncbi:MAG: 1-phosphofructokinase family hexose kinase [Hyphomicrobiales bacterium]
MNVVTLTMNPAIDVSTSIARLVPVHKLRCSTERRDPGGGGINVARVVTRLGADVRALYPVGGPIGQLLRRLVDRERISSLAIEVSGETREDLAVFDEASGAQYRFVLPGPRLAEAEWQQCLEVVSSLRGEPGLIVASGSLPPGVPADFYGRLARLAKNMGARLVLDTSGEPLASALEEGVYLVKPSLSELAGLTRTPLEEPGSQIEACLKLVRGKRAEIVALTLGDQGALLVTRDRAWRAAPLRIEAVSSVGAGDSFLGGMIWSLASGHSLEDALRYGVAAGSAAVLAHGTELCHAEDVRRLHPLVEISAFDVPAAHVDLHDDKASAIP